MAEEASKDSGKTVVIAIDGSEYAKKAFDWYKTNIHKDTDKVVLVHAVEMHEILNSQQWYATPYSFDKDTLFAILEKEKEKVTAKLEEFAQLLREAKINGTVKSVHSASPGEGICKVAKEVNADLVITGTRGLGSVRRTLLGSVSDYILHHAHVPVIVCRH
ncbi:universal stress protein in QAH/OAS sulfhydrylase 3'region-like [Crassostrea virginica]|uniref:Uncharacterized protein LOC111106096 n=1 Tax=Crassostrea virginica TaxID=6565 RepID=A0A8B8B140_CRAVI|nr:uncharacterized protein LOC111106096 [Crassostrea virginica]